MRCVRGWRRGCTGARARNATCVSVVLSSSAMPSFAAASDRPSALCGRCKDTSVHRGDAIELASVMDPGARMQLEPRWRCLIGDGVSNSPFFGSSGLFRPELPPRSPLRLRPARRSEPSIRAAKPIAPSVPSELQETSTRVRLP